MHKKRNGAFSKMVHRLSIRHLIFISFTLTALVVITMTGVTFYLRFSQQLENTKHGENQILVEQSCQSLNNYLGNMIRLSDSVSFQIVKNMDMDSALINEQLQLLCDVNSNYIKSITLFAPDGSVLATAPPALLKEDMDVTSEEWFEKALSQTENLHFTTPTVQKLFVDYDSQYNWVISLSCAAEFTERRYVRKGVLLIDLKYSALASLFDNMALVNNGYVMLIDSNGTLIYHPKHQLIATGLFTEDNALLGGYRDGDYVIDTGEIPKSIIVRSVGYTGWKIIGVIPRQGLTFSSMQNILFVLTIMLLYFALIVLLNAIISNRLTIPIKKLEQSVQQARIGFSKSEIYIGGSTEIQQLGSSIQQMVTLMHQLTEEIIQEQTQKQKSELNALQSQINPHFLYNTLDIIVWSIEKGKAGDALTIVSALAKFFRISLSKGKNVITVRDELEHVRNYLMIQTMRYKNRFTYSIQADPQTLDLSTIKLVLQPIAENAIYHGMEYMFDDDGEIAIKAYLEDGDLYLSVTDNGLGMTPETVSHLLLYNTPSSKGSGIGIKNVNERIGLYFGSIYGVIIESEPDKGTCVKLHFPAVRYGEMEEK